MRRYLSAYLPASLLSVMLFVSAASAEDLSRPPPSPPPFDYWQRAQETHDFTVTYLLSPWHSYWAFSHDTTPTSASYEWFDASQIYADAAMLRGGDASYLPYMNNTYYNYMHVFWDFGSSIGGYYAAAAADGSWVATDRKYVDDNALTAVAYLDAAEAVSSWTTKQDYINSAKAIANYLMHSGLWDSANGGGFRWNTVETFRPTQSNGLALQMFLRLYALTGQQFYMNWANSIKTWLDATLFDRTDGLYGWHTEFPLYRKFTYDQAIMIEANLLYYKITRRSTYLTAAQKLAVNLHKKNWNPLNGGYYIRSDEADGGHLLSPTLSGWASQSLVRLYEADGNKTWLYRARQNVDFFNRFAFDPTWLGYWGNNAPDGTVTGWFFQTVDQAWMQRTQALLAKHRNVR